MPPQAKSNPARHPRLRMQKIVEILKTQLKRDPSNVKIKNALATANRKYKELAEAERKKLGTVIQATPGEMRTFLVGNDVTQMIEEASDKPQAATDPAKKEVRAKGAAGRAEKEAAPAKATPTGAGAKPEAAKAKVPERVAPGKEESRLRLPDMKLQDIQKLRWRAQKAIQDLNFQPRSPERDQQLKEYRELVGELGDRVKGEGGTLKDLGSTQIRKIKALPFGDIKKYLEPVVRGNGAPASSPAQRADSEQAASAGAGTASGGGAGRPTAKPSTVSGGELREGTRTIPRPGTIARQDVNIPLKELQDYRRQLQGKRYRYADMIQKASSPERQEQLKRDLAPYDKAYNTAVALERQYYDSGEKKPDDWAGAGPKDMPRQKALGQADIKIDQLPKGLTEVSVNVERFAREPGPKRAGEEKEATKDKTFLNNEIRRVVNDLSKVRREIDQLDPRIPGNRDQIAAKEQRMDRLKEKHRLLRKELPHDIEDTVLSEGFRDLARELKDLLPEDQRAAFQRGEEIDVSKLPDRTRFLRTLRELGREGDRIKQSMGDELRYLGANPQNKIEDFRAMDPDERREVLEDIGQESFLQNVAQGVEGYFDDVTKGKKGNFQDLEFPVQQEWMKRYAASEARKGTPGFSGSDIYKFLFGGGQEFISKYPPEIYRPMVQAARQGLRGLGQSNQMLRRQLQQSPMEQLFGQQAAPNLSQLFLGVTPEGAQPMQQPQQPQPYEFPLNQQAALPNLRQMLENEV